MRFVYDSFEGRFSDSPRALYEALLARGGDAEHIWIADPRYADTFPAGVETVGVGTAECVAALESADFVIANTHLDLHWDKRPDTTYLQTWHGTPLKTVHHDVRWAPPGRLDRLSRDVDRWDLLLSPNRTSTRSLRSAFRFTGPVLETGYPRNDLLRSASRDAVRDRVRRQLGLAEGTTAVLYAPTWRDDVLRTDADPFALQLDLDAVASQLGPDHVLLLRLHYLVSDQLQIPDGLAVRDLTHYPDINELYLASDVLVTDYSSSMFDFALTGKPILLYTYDLEYFRDELRGFYLNLEEVAPGPLLRSPDEVVGALRDLKSVAAEHANAYAAFLARFGYLEDGRATDRVLDLVVDSGTRRSRAVPAMSVG